MGSDPQREQSPAACGAGASQAVGDDLLIRVHPSVFVLGNAARRYVFAPLSRAYAAVNDDLCRLLEVCRNPLSIAAARDRCGLPEDCRPLLENLLRCGILVAARQSPDDTDDSSRDPGEHRFTQVAVFPTNNCNLACTYCYARAGERTQNVPLDAVDVLFQWFFEQLPEGIKQVSLSLHGGGEPTFSFPLLRGICDRFLGQCTPRQLEGRIGLVSNGTFSEEVGDWLLERNLSVNISADGPPDIQDSQRPFRTGAGSHAVVERNIRKFVAAGRDVPIRATITHASVARMEEILEYFIALGVRSLQLEPCFFVGRCAETGIKEPDADEFSERFCACFRRGLEADVEVAYSGFRCTESPRDRFCGACGEMVALTPDGRLTGCFEVVHPDDPAATVFGVGRVDLERKMVHLDQSALAALRRRRTANLDGCANCFLKFHCAGDCVVKAFRDTGGIYGQVEHRCRMARQINHRVISWIADGVIVPRRPESALEYAFGACPA